VALGRGLRKVGIASAIATVIVFNVVSPALADRGFTPRFSTNANGDIAVVGNTLESCQSSAADCANARAGKGAVLNNNNFVMERVDVDHTMLDSSAADLRLPTGVRVLFAGLYYGARTTAGTRGKAAPDDAPSALRTVDLRAPDASRYERLSGELDESTEVKGAYGVFVDVTRQVRRGGSGSYTVANVQSATGEDRYADWALVVAYEAAGEPPRNLTVFDGLQSVTLGKPALTIPVSGFQTPLSGSVRTKLGFVADEGDLGATGDSAALDGKALSDALSPANNFFNSTISADGRPITQKNPNYVNQLGFDAKVVGINGILANGATSANLTLRSTGDQYLPHAITFATDLYAPAIHATKTVVNLTRPDQPAETGDTLRYTVRYTNEGLEAARHIVAEDPLPGGVTYLADSMRIPGAAADATHPSDIQGDDLGEYDASARAVRFFLGAGASPGQGGELAAAAQPGNQAEISFEARVDDDVTSEHEITDVAQASFLAPSLNKQLSALSSPATITVIPGPPAPPPADLAVDQTETVAPGTGGSDVVDDHILIENHGPGDATDVVVHERISPGATVESVTADQGSCTVSPDEVTCTVPHLDAGGSVDINTVLSEPGGDASSGSVDEATVTASQFDPTPGNNSGEVTAPQPPSSGVNPPVADLGVQVHESATTASLGSTLTETMMVTNRGPDAATGVDLTDVLGAATELIAVNPGRAACSASAPLHCTLATLPPGASLTIGRTLRPLGPGRLIDAASVSANELDANVANNLATASTTVRRRTTAARLRIVPVQPVAHPGHAVSFVIIATVTKPVPGVTPMLCVTLPTRLLLTSAPKATTNGTTVCWRMTDLVAGHPQTFRLRARIAAARTSGTTLAVHGRLAGGNFGVTRAAASVQVPRRVVACASRALGIPRARIAC
jgi:large repetitive protein